MSMTILSMALMQKKRELSCLYGRQILPRLHGRMGFIMQSEEDVRLGKTSQMTAIHLMM